MNIIMATLTDILRGLAVATLLLLAVPLVRAMLATIRESEGEQ